jgi:type II secretory pathway component PulF
LIASQTTINRDVREFVAHQLAQEISAGTPLSVAADKVRKALPDEYQWAIGDVERMLAGGPAPPKWLELETLLRAARDNGVDDARTFSAFQQAAQAARTQVAGVLAGATSLGVYIATLTVLLIVVLLVYSIFVLPQIRAVFDTLGAPLPAFTEAAIGNTWILVPVLALLVLAIVAGLVGLARLKERMSALQPLYPLLRRVPILGRWSRSHDAGLWLRYLAIFLDAGATENTARNAAAQIAGSIEHDHRSRLLHGAALLGRLREELARQIETDERESIERFERPRNDFVLLARLAIYVVIAGYVIAMYLPIFKIGAVV